MVYDHFGRIFIAMLRTVSKSAVANVTMQLSYTASVEYELPDLSPASWLDLTYR